MRFLGLIEQAGSGTTTQRKHLRVLHSCLKAAVRKGYAGRNPVADLDESERPQARRKEAAYFLDDELPRLISELPEGLYRTLCTTKTGFVNEQSLLRRILYPAMERAKVPRACPEGRARGELRTFHSFRHSFSRIALENGRELSWLSRHLGHSSLAITEGVYGHWSKAAAKAQAASMEGVFGV